MFLLLMLCLELESTETFLAERCSLKLHLFSFLLNLVDENRRHGTKIESAVSIFCKLKLIVMPQSPHRVRSPSIVTVGETHHQNLIMSIQFHSGKSIRVVLVKNLYVLHYRTNGAVPVFGDTEIWMGGAVWMAMLKICWQSSFSTLSLRWR